MPTFQDQQRVVSFVRVALECSVYVAPLQPGLTHAELLELGGRLGYQPGEINDALTGVYTGELDGPRGHLMPDVVALCESMHFHFPQEPDFRSFDAAEFMFVQMNERARAAGRDKAAVERSVLVERAVQSGLSRHDAQVAITLMILAKIVREQAGIVSFTPGRAPFFPPSEQRRLNARPGTMRTRSGLAKVHDAVRDVVARRADGRAPSSEPLDAFAAELQGLGYGAFRMWWTQTVAELRQCDAQTSPLAATVLAAALVEGVLTFVVKHAQDRGMGTMGSKDFDKAPQHWRIDDLVASAARGQDAILDSASHLCATALVKTRQRIHAGRMIADYQGGPPDLRPDEARDAKGTAELVVRRVLDWLGKHPVSAAP